MGSASDMKILVLGAEGMLGHKVLQTLSAIAGVQVIGSIRGKLSDPFYAGIPLFSNEGTVENVDVMQLEALQGLLERIRPSFVINCVGIIKQRDSALLPIPSITLNSLLPHLLADWSRKWGGKVVHFSTDCVFSGRRGGYKEDDPSDAEDLYGKSKYLGEVSASNALTLRTSIIGRELANFRSLLEWFLNQRGGRIQGYRKAIYSGVTTNYIAQLVGRIVVQKPDLHGLYQVTSTPLSKLDLLCKLRDAYRLDVEIEPVEGELCDRSMLGDRFAAETGYVTPGWDELVEQLVADATPYEQWRA
jgi:dTDP-4-dehydrorhamnose reductase